MHPRFVCGDKYTWNLCGILLCGPERWIVDRGPIYKERHFEAAMKKTDKTIFLVLRFLNATPFVVFMFYFYGLACFVVFSHPARKHLALALYLD